jgi:tRNA threonylcarbamoyl adenosine modification protein YeaZ
VKAALGIVACGPRLELALAGDLLAAPGLVALAGPTPRSDLIVAAIDLLLAGAGLRRDSLDGVAATRGPGSFTGVRVGLATALGIARALGLPARAFDSLTVQATRCAEDQVIAVQPARRGHVYAQRFLRSAQRFDPVGPPEVVSLASLSGVAIPVAAPAGIELAVGTIRATALCTAAEAVLRLFSAEPDAAPETLIPIYHEPPPAVPPVRTAKPWPLSPKAS